MGRWAQRRRTGGTNHFGTLIAPGTDDWSLTQDGTGYLIVTRIAPFPAGANSWRARGRFDWETDWSYYAWRGDSSFTIGPAAPGPNYTAQISWGNASIQICPWSASKAQTFPA